MSECIHCGDSGVLNILAWITTRPGDVWHDERITAHCHACPMGATWKEVGL